MIDCLLGGKWGDFNLWYANGGQWLEREDLELMRWVANHLKDKVSLTRSVKTADSKIDISHAQPPCRNWKDCEDQRLNAYQIETILWASGLIESKLSAWTCENFDLTIHGHKPVQEYKKIGNALFIDTGSYFKEFGYNEYPGVRILRIDDIIKNMGDRL